ncbi:hypothetical protein HPB49_002697 [Dermacentor silvarum]|uniref:Uncharacterized protein n=1 Tax=Dermacentor silvarum TaxID=543639 RepID=A0ACB8CPE4_DERSI|nr:hypothetical protein HPB49_002697 [Dermacentor silvarum]
MDVAHPSCVSPDDFTGESAWIRQVAEKRSVCLSIARVVIEVPFGQLSTEAAISASLPDNCPYLFSNRSEQMLKERGESFSSEAAPKSEARTETRRLIGVFPIEQQSEDHGTIPEAAASGNEPYVSVAECEGKTVTEESSGFPASETEGPLGQVCTEAATSASLPEKVAYFSNRSDQVLKKRRKRKARKADAVEALRIKLAKRHCDSGCGHQMKTMKRN